MKIFLEYFKNNVIPLRHEYFIAIMGNRFDPEIGLLNRKGYFKCFKFC